MLLVAICAYWLDTHTSKVDTKNFLLGYIVLTVMSLLFDMVNMGSLPSFDSMTPGKSFSTGIWVIVFFLKIATLGTIFFFVRGGKNEEYKPYHDAPNNQDD